MLCSVQSGDFENKTLGLPGFNTMIILLNRGHPGDVNHNLFGLIKWCR